MNNSAVDSFANFVSGVYLDINNPVDYPLSRISGWFLDNSNIGKINNLIGLNISGVVYNTTTGSFYALEPELSSEEMSIYKKLFECDFYKRQSFEVARSISMIGDWISIKDGDSSITRVNKNEVSKNFRSIYKDSYEELQFLIKMYLKKTSSAEQIAGDDTIGSSYYYTNDKPRNIY